ncbi:LamG domain-containing protein, partial [Chryseosolibacter indicus]
MSNYQWNVVGGTVTSGGSTSDNSVTVTWGSAGTGSVGVNYTNGGCVSPSPTVKSVTINPVPTPSATGPASVCVNTTGSVYTTQAGMSNYVWSVQGGVITSGGTTTDNSVTVIWTTTGSQRVSVSYANVYGCTASAIQSVEVLTPPLPVEEVLGLKVNFVNEQSHLQVTGAEDATSLIWEYPSGTTGSSTGTGIPGREVVVSHGTAGSKTLKVKASKNGCSGGYSNVVMNILPESAKNQELVMPEPAIKSSSEGFLFMDKHSSNHAGCINEYGPVTFRVRANFGERYNLGELPFNITIHATVTAYYDLPSQLQSWPVSFKLSQNSPEQLFTRMVSASPELIKFIGIKVDSYTTSHAVAGSYVQLSASYEEQDQVQANGAVVTLVTPEIDNTKWEQTFKWHSSCADVPNYEFQLLRIYGGEAIDWSSALKLYTESSTPEMTVTMGEGGDNSTYQWRVRAIGNKSGGLTNPLNLQAAWSGVNTFTYTHPESELNWIYSRTFSEGNKVSEHVTYANGLQQVAQQQTRIQGINQIVASQTLQDYSGRNAVSSLPIPVKDVNRLGYVNGLLSNGTGNYGASDFDVDPINAGTATDKGGYYSGTDNGINAGVAGAEGYPYTRTLYTTDGTGRVKEQSGVGAAHAMKGLDRRTVKTFYTNPTEAELVRVFGREAPLAKSVQKIVTFDANGTGSATYQTKDGKVIATALVVSGSTGGLTALNTRSGGTSTVFEELTTTERQDAYTAVTRKPLLFTTDNTTLTVNYNITPSQLKELCAGGVNSQGLLGYYPFEGNSNDGSGLGNHALVYGGAGLATDAINGQCYNLDGSDDYIELIDNTDLDFGSGDFSVSFWVRKNANTSGWDNSAGVNKWNNTSMAGSNEWQVGLSTAAANNLPMFSIESGTVQYSVYGSTNLNVNTWYHLAAVRRAGQLFLYVNGVQQGTPVNVGNVSVNNVGRPLWIGKTGAGYNTAALYDDVSIYKRGLSVEEVKQLYQRSGPLCKTCDYKIEFFLRRDDDPDYAHPNLPAPQLIRAGECSEQTALRWLPPAFTLTGLSAAVNYTLEKKITINTVNPLTGKTYQEEHETQLRTYYQGQADATLTTINNFIANKDLKGLKAHLDASYQINPETQEYIIPIGTGTGGCREYIFIPVLSVCNEVTGAEMCQTGNVNYEHYFESYMSENHADYVLKNGTSLNYAFFTNYASNSKQYYVQGQLNAMIANMLSENGGASGRLTCQMVWDTFIEETEVFVHRKIDASEASAEDLASIGGGVIATENNLVQNLLNALEGKLKGLMPGTEGVGQDVCDGGSNKPYFIKKTELYGKIGGASVNPVPDVTRAYRLVYFDESKPDQSNALRYYAGINDAAAALTLTTFNSLDDCKKYKLHQQTQFGAQPQAEDEATEANKKITAIRSKCAEGCRGRSEEFRQAIINNIYIQNATAKIQYYAVNKSMLNSRWYGVRDTEVNATTYDYSECEIDNMVDALVQNCIDNYCNTPLTPTLQDQAGSPMKV